jgi:hypothetical protein
LPLQLKMPPGGRTPDFLSKIVSVDQLHAAFFTKSAYIAVGDCARQEIRLHQKKSGLSPTHFSVFLRSTKGEARGQIRLLVKNTPISVQIQRFGAALYWL